MNSAAWSDAEALAYIASFADLRGALGADPAAGRRHYAQFGAAEGRTIGFDPMNYLASFADLRAAFGTDAVAAARHFITSGAAEGRVATFDAWGYLASYADLREAFGTDAAAATRHFVFSGAGEGRTVGFDAFGYLASHADLRAAFGTDAAAATRHFVFSGAGEGRTVDFDAFGYLASHADLRAAFGTDAAAATRHFVFSGAGEGRTVSFDALAYLASYPDLRAAFGTDAAAATRHFVFSGAREGRSVTFDPVAYLLSQPDLAGKLTVGEAARHFLTTGADEGRSVSGSFGTEQAGHALPFGRTISGRVDAAGDRDWFQIDLSAGQGTTLSFFSSTGNGVVAVYDATGQVQQVTRYGARTSFMPAADGSYYVVVSTANSATGDYALRAEDRFTVFGTSGNDTLAGTAGADLLVGFEGNDVLGGGGGNDVLEGGLGYDRLDGGLGDDTLYGNNAGDVGEDGTDSLSDDQGGNDRLYGQGGNDSIDVTRTSAVGAMPASTVLLDGGAGDDRLSFFALRLADDVTILGGAGNDDISLNSALRGVINAGEGDDVVQVAVAGGDRSITLGLGTDLLRLVGYAYDFAVGDPLRVTDFTSGVDRIAIDSYLTNVLLQWDGVRNPFATGHLKLVQAGSDTQVQLDRDGAAGSDYGFATLLTLSGITGSTLTARDLGYAPDGSAPTGTTVVGTSGNDTLAGTDGADLVQGLAGRDELDGRGGDDVLEGGSGYDRLNGGLGNDTLYGNNAANTGVDDGDSLSDYSGGDDRLFGQDGDDTLYVSRLPSGDPNGTSPAGALLLDGGSGSDSITYFSNDWRVLDTVAAIGGTGNDRIYIVNALRSTVDAGDGNDDVSIGTGGGDQTITLGSGADLLTLISANAPFAPRGLISVSDFAAGTDVLDLTPFLQQQMSGWDGVSNPFGSGHLKLVQSGNDSLLQFDRDGAAGTDQDFVTLLSFAGTQAVALTARDLGHAPDGSAAVGWTLTGTAEADRLLGSQAADRIHGLAGDDVLEGRGGDDLLEGGEGFDQLDGGAGNDRLYGNNAANTGLDGRDILRDDLGGDDRLYGQDGDDDVLVFRYDQRIAASTVVLDGGAGNDVIGFASNRGVDTVTITGGTGDDQIEVGSVLRAVVDAGDGTDVVTIAVAGGDQSITLGEGADLLKLDGTDQAFATTSAIRVTDFAINSDVLDLSEYLGAALVNWSNTSNPFATGHLKLVQSGTDTEILIDRDGSAGSAHGFTSLLTLAGTTASSLTARDIGYPVDPAAAFGNGDEAYAFAPAAFGDLMVQPELLGI